MKSIYIVGAQCTGKTTLTEAVASRLRTSRPDVKVDVINEMARSVLDKYNFTREDVREGSQRCMLLQKLILDSQYSREMAMDPKAVLLSDRSGIDPLAYAAVFIKGRPVEELIDSPSWRELKTRMKKAMVIVCEPVEDWLFDDGVRLMPADSGEWARLHQIFCHLLEDQGISYTVLPSKVRILYERVEFVLDMWKAEGDGVARTWTVLPDD